jgi:hypothetical protein
MAVAELAKGDRVRCRKDLGDLQSWRYGVIDKVYQGMPDGNGNRETLYAVCWDDTKVVERGYLRISLEPMTAIA